MVSGVGIGAARTASYFHLGIRVPFFPGVGFWVLIFWGVLGARRAERFDMGVDGREPH